MTTSQQQSLREKREAIVKEQQSLREKREAIVKEHVNAENRHDADASVATFFTPRYQVFPMGIIHDGADAVRELLSGIFAGFPDFRVGKLTRHTTQKMQ
jgi:ketosteroid isomerase-like protein